MNCTNQVSRLYLTDIADAALVTTKQALVNATLKIEQYQDAAFRLGEVKRARESLERAERALTTQVALERMIRG